MDDPAQQPDPGGPPEPGAAQGRGSSTGSKAGKVKNTSRAIGHSVASTARFTGRAGRFALGAARRASGAQGARETGLNRLLELNALNSAGNAAVAISLAGSLFFSVPTGEARGQVALFLGMTLLPFAVVAPLIGPLLDRFSHGRRWAIGATLAVRAFLAWVLAGALAGESRWMFPAALGVLVASKAYSVTSNAAIPRLLPGTLTLVKANGRCSLAGIVGAAVSAPLALLTSTIGPQWSLRYAFVMFVLATIAAIMLPAKVDSTEGEEQVDLDGRNTKGRFALPAPVRFALKANCGPRFMTGFLVMYMAFLLRDQPVSGWKPELLIAVVIGAAGAGNTLGIALASLLKRLNPAVTVVVALVADAVAAVAAVLWPGVVTLVVLGLVAGAAQSLAKLSLDSTIQTHVPERVRTSAFARSDTMLQVAWVVGGFVGIFMPLNQTVGLSVAAGVLTVWFVVAVLGVGLPRRGNRPPRDVAPDAGTATGATDAGAAGGPESDGVSTVPIATTPLDDRD